MLNAVVIGNLGRDAELRATQGGKAVCNFSVAAKVEKKDAPPVWIRCALWGARAEKVAQYLTKGKRVAVNGALATREHDGKTYLELEVNQLEMLGGGEKSDDAPAAHVPPPARRPPPAASHVGDYDSEGDDVPF